MMASLKKLASILKSDEGMVSVEYGVVLGGVVAVATAVTAGLVSVGESVETMMTAISTAVAGYTADITGP